MRSLADTLVRLGTHARATQAAGPGSPLRPFHFDGSNPGGLSAHVHAPTDLPRGSGMVVALHGCTQKAAEYDRGTGWSAMADVHGFVVLLPEQRRANNPGLCFNWFSPEDARRDVGEALSIAQMVQAAIRNFDLDPDRVFITGLSAGGAMTSVMLATYPELFAGGGVIAGLPFGVARTVSEAFERMRGHGLPADPAATASVRAATGHKGSWPILTVFHGDADATVDVLNAEALVRQWLGLHGRSGAPDIDERVGLHQRRIWTDAEGRPLVEDYRLRAMGHGVPIDSRGDDPCGTAGPYMLEAGLSSTRELIRLWGLGDGKANGQLMRLSGTEARAHGLAGTAGSSGRPTSNAIHDVIDKALRTAGLLR